MGDRFEISGGAGEFEAAVVAVVLDRIAQEEQAAIQGAPRRSLSAWIRALDLEESDSPFEAVYSSPSAHASPFTGGEVA